MPETYKNNVWNSNGKGKATKLYAEEGPYHPLKKLTSI
jgi:hypothetical protein